MTDAVTDLRIRTAEPGDAAALADLWNLAGLTRWWNDPQADLDRFLRQEHATVLVGEEAERVVASVCVGHDAHRGWVYYLAVHPNCQRRGYGRQLTRAAELWLSERHIPRLNVMVRAGNHAAISFYGALGYTQSAVAVMQRWLQPPQPSADAPAQPDESGMLDVTITYLEMTEQPTQPPPHAPAGKRVALMRAERPTVHFYRYLYNTIGADWLWWERRALDDAALARVIENDRVEIYVLYVDGVPAGYAELDRRQEPVIDLAYLGLMPEYTGQALGPYLLGAAVHTAWTYEPAKLTVNTNTLDHPKALPLYQRMGFQPVRRETTQVPDPRLNGLIPLI